MKLIKQIFGAIDTTVWFDSPDTMHKFEKTCLVDKLYIEHNIRKVNNVTTIIGGFEDGHCEATYPIKRNKVRDFKFTVMYFDHFFTTNEVKLLG